MAANKKRPKPIAAPKRTAAEELPIIAFKQASSWQSWLEGHHAEARGVWLTLAKKTSGRTSVTYKEAVEVALCWGWIDGQARPLDETSWLVRFTPRGRRSVWSKINRARVEALIAGGAMRAPGLAEIERAKRDGRWDTAYDSPRTAAVPPDLEAALAGSPRAQSSFASLNAANRYAILWRLQTAKLAQTRARRITQFVDMLERGELIHPTSRKKKAE